MSEIVTALFIIILIYELMQVSQDFTDLNLIYAGAVLVVLLLQSAAFQKLKGLLDGERNFDRSAWHRAFTIFRPLDLVLLCVYPVLLLILFLTDWLNTQMILYGILTILVAAVEYYRLYLRRESEISTYLKEEDEHLH